MGNLKASSVAPITQVASPLSNELGGEQPREQPRDFHFAVTWVTLFAHLDPIEAAGPWRRVQNPSPTRALVPVAAPPLAEQNSKAVCENAGRENAGWENPGRENAAWEMVVPKMVRSDSGDFYPAEREKRRLL
jgi:hypothetical protein